ncbi:hypothetical protein OQA88_7764 [Cercophora sp. LCS_1]
MKFTAALVAFFATAVMAAPTGGGTGEGSGGCGTPSCPGSGSGGSGGSGSNPGGPGAGSGGGGGGAAYDPCSGLYDSAQCCATDVLGVANLDCGSPPSAPTSAASFSSICAGIGQRARCCVIPALDQGILCQTPVGVAP